MTEYDDLTGGGTFHKWEEPGESVEGIIVSFTVDGGTDYNGNPCPELVLRTDYGDVTITAGQASLRRICERNADHLKRDHKAKVTYRENLDTGKGNPAKLFKVQVSPEPVMDDLPSVAVEDDGEPF